MSGNSQHPQFPRRPEEVRGEFRPDLTFSPQWVIYRPATGREMSSTAVRTVARYFGEWEGPERFALATFDLKNDRYNPRMTCSHGRMCL